MNELLSRLRDLTQLDREIVTTREQLTRYPELLARMDRTEATQREAIAATETGSETARQERRKAEKEIAALREHARKYQLQQTQVKTNKEYQALTHEIDQIGEKIDALETAALEQLEAEDNAEKQRKKAQEALAALEREHATERARIEEQKRDKEQRLERLGEERVHRLAALDDDLREQYEILNERYPGSAAVPLENNQCGGCHWALVPHTQQRVRRGDELVQCEHCRRFLYAV